MELKQIGVIHTPYKTSAECPCQACKSESIAEIEVFKEYEGGLKDVEGFSHLVVLYLMHKSKGYSLLVITPWDTEPHGLFTTRSPHRPNPIGISIVRLLERKGNILRVRGVDAIDGTPLIDIKPYVPEFDETPFFKRESFTKEKFKKREVRIGWLEGKVKR